MVGNSLGKVPSETVDGGAVEMLPAPIMGIKSILFAQWKAGNGPELRCYQLELIKCQGACGWDPTVCGGVTKANVGHCEL